MSEERAPYRLRDFGMVSPFDGIDAEGIRRLGGERHVEMRITLAVDEHGNFTEHAVGHLLSATLGLLADHCTREQLEQVAVKLRGLVVFDRADQKERP